MNSAKKITEEDLLKRFDEIQEQMNEFLKKYSIDAKKDLSRSVETAPIVVVPIFSYEIHASG